MLLSLPSVQSQRLLKGLLFDESTGSAITDATIMFLRNGEQDYSNDNGKFFLSLDSCDDCKPGNSIKLQIQHSDYPNIEKEVLLNSEFTTVIHIKSDQLIKIDGAVKDQNTNSFLEGINVKIVPYNKKTKELIDRTDEYGYFEFEFNKKEFGEIDFIELYFVDPSKKYEDFRTAKPVESAQGLEIIMKSVVSRNISPYLTIDEALYIPGVKQFLEHYMEYYLYFGNRVSGYPPHISLSRLEIIGNKLKMNYNYVNGTIEGKFRRSDKVFEGKYSNGWGSGTFEVIFNSDSTSTGSYFNNDIFKKGGDFYFYKL